MESLPQNEELVLPNCEQKSKLLQLPDYIIENYIFPYLSGKELFFNVRAVHPYLHEIVKLSWGNSIKEEMFSQLKNLTFIYEKDALTKAYEFKLQYLFNYRNLIMLYNINTNIIEVFGSCIDYISNDNVYRLIIIFLGIFVENNLMNIIIDNNIDIDSKRLVLVESLKNEELIDEYKMRISLILDINNESEGENLLFERFNTTFSEIDRENIENINESCRLIYSFLQGLIEFQILKKNVNNLKLRVEQLMRKIQIETEMWPKRKKFFENAYKILLYSKSSSDKFIYVNNIFNFFSIRSPLYEFREESYELMVELRNIVEDKKEKIIKKIQEDDNNEKNNIMDDLSDILFKNLLDKRLLLTKKIVITEKFFDIFLECGLLNTSINKDTVCKLKSQDIRLDELLKCLLLTSHTYPNEINVDTITKIYVLLKISLEEDKNLFVITEEQKMKANEISPENKKEIEYLKKQKEGLIKQKEKAEQMLNVLKLFMESQEKYLLNKEKYKPLLFVLTKVENQINIDRVEELLKKSDVENIIFTEDEINQNEFENLQNIEVNENLFKQIENALMNRINNFFQQEKITTQKILTERDSDYESTKEETQNENNINIKDDNKDKEDNNNKDKGENLK